jgi:glycosyltransferase involved in cell wall biosynthesis
MSNKLFSVIIPSYNRADALKRALDSLAEQTCKEFEVLVCDDGSTDHTSDIVTGFQSALNITYIHDENWGGPARPRNHGIKKATGEWICFLDSDDWWYPNKLECCKKVLDKVDVIYHNLSIHSVAGKIGEINTEKVKRPVTQNLLRNGNKMPNSSLVIRKSIIDKIGFQLEDPEVISSEDYEFLLRISTVTDKFHFISVVLGAYWQGDNISGDTIKHLKSEQKVVDLYNEYTTNCIENEIHYRHQYVMGRHYQKNKHYKDAIPLFRKAIKSHSFKIKFKSLISFFSCLLMRIK